ncbi:uncharacterized protein [Physcomitrium patens]|uniref:uncharacterized protein n=1 Tax=Physcomitrium patens TaxID=3218 RepID=UPI000D159ED2|nr:uncharacterized protein LOC112275243 [Physcomitrium patens]|eukprot:XP_024361212.1 uncharacterized protein LOC112275243 [Physcomitrella patens]
MGAPAALESSELQRTKCRSKQHIHNCLAGTCSRDGHMSESRRLRNPCRKPRRITPLREWDTSCEFHTCTAEQMVVPGGTWIVQSMQLGSGCRDWRCVPSVRPLL